MDYGVIFGENEDILSKSINHFNKMTINHITQFDILKDTSLAYTRSVLQDPFNHSIRNGSLQRTLIYFLMTNSPHSKVIDYMNQYANGDPLCLEYCVIKLTQKERELKMEGRLFGQSPYVERARRCILENELEKFKKLYQLSRIPVDHKDYYAVYISIDVEAWNNNFGRPYCEPVGEHFFDKIFGTSHFKHVMRTFEVSRYLIDDGVFEYSYQGQYGGIEGQAHKFGTWLYNAVASRVAASTGQTNFILVNGDDLRVILLFAKEDYPDPNLFKKALQNIALDFENEYKEFGFFLKVQETYFSTSLLGLGKVYLNHGYFCSNMIKKGAKMHGMANLLIH